MIIKSLPLLLVVAAVGMIGLFGLNSPVAAQQPAPVRSFDQTEVNPGDALTVTISGINLAGTQSFMGFCEILPPGFSYIPGSERPTAVDSGDPFVTATTTADSAYKCEPATGHTMVEFTTLALDWFTYRVSVDSDAPAGPANFSGHNDAQEPTSQTGQVVVRSSATPTPTPISASGITRTLSPATVAPGGEVTVTISGINLANESPIRAHGRVEETLPTGFSYVDGSATSSSGATDRRVKATPSTTTPQTVKLTHFRVNSFEYKVSVGTNVANNVYSFSGYDQSNTKVGGDTTVTVMAPVPDIVRSFSSDWVMAGGEVTVTISGINLANESPIRAHGRVVETLPAGFSYVDGSATSSSGATDRRVKATPSTTTPQTVKLTHFRVNSFEYKVSVGTNVADNVYSFSGYDQGNTKVGGDSSLRVGPPPTPTPTPTPTATPEPTATPTPVPTAGPDDPKAATPTPRPTQVPAPTPTPVPIEIVDVTAVDGASTVQPDASATVSSADGMATLMLPKTSRARTYQVMVSSDASTCPGVNDLSGSRQAGANVSVYDAEGNMESGVMLIRRATVQMMLSSDTVDDLGGLPVVFQANALGAFSVHQSGASDNWSMRGFSMGLTDDGGVTATVTSLGSLGCLALTVDEGILEQASFQVAGITPTPTPRPATPVPTATPEPTPTPEPVEEEPKVGDTTAPIGLLIVLALTGALMIYTGSRVVRSRRPTRL